MTEKPKKQPGWDSFDQGIFVAQIIGGCILTYLLFLNVTQPALKEGSLQAAEHLMLVVAWVVIFILYRSLTRDRNPDKPMYVMFIKAAVHMIFLTFLLTGGGGAVENFTFGDSGDAEGITVLKSDLIVNVPKLLLFLLSAAIIGVSQGEKPVDL